MATGKRLTGAAPITRRELAARLKVHPGTPVKWERDGMPVAERGRKGKPSLYDETAVRAWLKAREDAAKAGKTHDVAQERAQKEHWQAVLAEQTFLARQRDLLPRAEVERAWAAEVAAIRTKLLALPTMLADRLHRASTLNGVAGVERALQEAVRNVLLELAGDAAPKPSRPSGKSRVA